MNGPSVFKVAAETNGKVFKSALFSVKGEHIGEGLCGVEMAAVACVDNGAVSSKSRSLCSTLGGVAHNHNVRIGGHYLGGILKILALCNR